MVCTDSGKACLVHLAFYTIQGFLIAIAYVAIFGDFSSPPDDINIVDDNPGLSYRPHPPDSELESLISYKIPHRESYMPWVDSLEKFLEEYRIIGLVPARRYNIVNCAYSQLPGPGQVCDIDMRSFGPCIAENYFDFHRGSPCVFLRLNMPRGWKPIFYNDSNSLPDDMPQDLKIHVQDLLASNSPRIKTIWVSCEGENSADKEFVGPVKYFPGQGFPGFYTLNTDTAGYLSPLVAIHFERPLNRILINIKCKLWARNIKHEKDSSMGGVKFRLLLD